MAKITVTYKLSPAGQRASLIAGGDGRAVQSVDIEATPELLALANVDRDGKASISLTTEGVLRDDRPVFGRLGRARYEQSPFEAAIAFDSPPADLGQWIIENHARAQVEKARVRAELEMEAAAAEKQRRQEAEAAVRAFLDGSRFRSATIEEGRVRLYTNDDRTGITESLSSSDFAAELLPQLQAKADQIAAEVKARKAAAEEAVKREIEEERAAVAAWVQEHGSERLKKCAEAGMLDNCIGVYRAERLAKEIGPNARWDSDRYEDDGVRNPSEAALDQLLALRLVYEDEDVSLIRQRRKGRDDVDDERWVTCVKLNLAWNPDAYAILPIDS